MNAVGNVRVVSDGTPSGTTITIDGRELEGILQASWHLAGFDQLAVLTLVVEGAEIDALGEQVTRVVDHVDPLKRVRVFKVDGRWWWWCSDCFGGDCIDETTALLRWRDAFDRGFQHETSRHRRDPP